MQGRESVHYGGKYIINMTGEKFNIQNEIGGGRSPNELVVMLPKIKENVDFGGVMLEEWDLKNRRLELKFPDLLTSHLFVLALMGVGNREGVFQMGTDATFELLRPFESFRIDGTEFMAFEEQAGEGLKLSLTTKVHSDMETERKLWQLTQKTLEEFVPGLGEVNLSFP